MRELTTEEILAQAPEVIDATAVSLSSRSQVHPWKRRRGSAKKKWWSANDRIKVATTYALVGNASEVERITGIPSATVRKWKTQDWWPQIIDRIRLEADDELDVKFTKVVDKALNLVHDRMERGDFIYDHSRGQLIRKPVSMRDAGSVATTFLDKRQLLRQKLDTRTQEASITERLKNLADQFESFTKAKTVSGTKVEESPEISDAEVVAEIPKDNKPKEVYTGVDSRKDYNLPGNTIAKYIKQVHPELQENPNAVRI